MAETPTNGSRLGIIERLATIITGLTLQNVLVLGILVVLAVPSYGVWQLLHDTELRKEVLSFAKEQELGVPCQVVLYSFSGQTEKTAVISNVDIVGHWEIIIGTRTPGMITAKDAVDACKATLDTAKQLRTVLHKPVIQDGNP